MPSSIYNQFLLLKRLNLCYLHCSESLPFAFHCVRVKVFNYWRASLFFSSLITCTDRSTRFWCRHPLGSLDGLPLVVVVVVVCGPKSTVMLWLDIHTRKAPTPAHFKVTATFLDPKMELIGFWRETTSPHQLIRLQLDALSLGRRCTSVFPLPALPHVDSPLSLLFKPGPGSLQCGGSKEV